ncbi:DUF4893 domain-containing protein [Sphingosinicella sp.]|uniref:DUF4893 domain-containing protein n=1 Tax=Sphingosinicella sp. TaxID=1917971 RepID=UPI0040376392
MPGSLRLSFLALALTGCQLTPPLPPSAAPVLPVGENWRAIVSPADADRLARLDAAWAATRAGASPLLAREAAGLWPAPPPGSYRCRVWRLAEGRAPRRFPAQFCHVGVEGALLSFAKQSGDERWAGYFYVDGERRMIFLGATAAREAAPGYGADAARDVAGVVERVGPLRYRIAMPWPRSGGALDIVELVPVAPALD